MTKAQRKKESKALKIWMPMLMATRESETKVQHHMYLCRLTNDGDIIERCIGQTTYEKVQVVDLETIHCLN